MNFNGSLLIVAIVALNVIKCLSEGHSYGHEYSKACAHCQQGWHVQAQMLLSSHKRPPCLLALCMSHPCLDCLWHNSRRALSFMASILGGAKAVCSISPVPPKGWIARCTKSMWWHDIVPSWHCVLPRSQSISVQVIWGILWSFAYIAASWGARTLECKYHQYKVIAKIHWTSASFIASEDAQSTCWCCRDSKCNDPRIQYSIPGFVHNEHAHCTCTNGCLLAWLLLESLTSSIWKYCLYPPALSLSKNGEVPFPWEPRWSPLWNWAAALAICHDSKVASR